MAILEIRDLIIDYGIIRAVKGINMDVNEGAIVAILGANGAGKTTTIRSISGVVKVKSGSIKFNEKNINNIDPYKIAGLGIIQSPEGRLILNGLTVEENLLVGAYSLKHGEVSILDSNGNSIKKCCIESHSSINYSKMSLHTFQYLKNVENNKHPHYLVVSNKC